MSDPIIRIENLGKKYRLTHQAERQSYTALRDVIADGAKRLFRRRTPGEREDLARSEDFWALKDVSLEIKQGDVVGIIGRNGAGKSTLLKLLSRITEPTTGCIRIRGRIASLLEVGTGFHPELTGRENIYLNGAILGMTRAEITHRFDEIVAFSEVETFLDTPVKRYSSGMYVRLAFAVAAHLEPDILVVDEVLAVGDAAFQKKCLGRLSAVSKTGRTVLFVSHNMSAVHALCGVGIWLDRGTLRQLAPIATVIGTYSTSLRQPSGHHVNNHIQLGPTLVLNRYVVSPSVGKTGEHLSLQFDIAAKTTTTLKAMSVIITSEYGTRVAVLDLRPHGIVDLALSTLPVQIDVIIPSLALVEGEYRIGFYVEAGDYQGDYLDIIPLTIAPATSVDGVVPYAAAYRGFLELTYTVRTKPSPPR